MNLPDIKQIIKAVKKIHLREKKLGISEDRDYLANQYIHDQTVKEIIDTLEGIDNGNIHIDDE